MNRRQRREELRGRKRDNETNRVARASSGVWTGRARSEDPKEEKIPDVPGFTCPPEEKEFQEKVDRNSWHDREEFDSFIAKIKQLSLEDNNDWCWAYNSECKYVDIRIDMRDGGFIVMDRLKRRINLPILEWQYKSVPK